MPGTTVYCNVEKWSLRGVYILYNNSFSIHEINFIGKQYWVMFSFFGNGTDIKRLFKGTNLHIAYRTKWIIQQLLKPKHSSIVKKMSSHWIYQLTCLDCGKKCTGQTGDEF